MNEQNILWFDVNLCVHGYSEIPLGNNDFLLFLCYFPYVDCYNYVFEGIRHIKKRLFVYCEYSLTCCTLKKQGLLLQTHIDLLYTFDSL